MSNFIVTDRNTDYLLPPSVNDWLEEDHLARFVFEVIDQLDLTRSSSVFIATKSPFSCRCSWRRPSDAVFFWCKCVVTKHACNSKILWL